MIKHLEKLLKECNVSVWRITEKKSETSELYFIKKQLDMPRKKVLTETNLEIFRDLKANGQKLRASTNVIVKPGMSDDEIKTAINDAFFAAQFAGNKFFELPPAEQCSHIASSSDLAQTDSATAAKKLADAIFAVDNEEDAFVNSAEIFVEKATVHIVGSNGLDVCFDECKAQGEFVAQCVTPKDVEQYRNFKFDSLNTQQLQKLVQEALSDVRARARSTRPPKAGNYTVVLKGHHIEEILSYYTTRSAASTIYPGYSQWTVGTDVQGETVGEKLNLWLAPSTPYSSEGIRMEKRKLLSDGVLSLVHGGARFCYYLNTAPTGWYSKIVCDNGTQNYKDMLGEGVLEPISFSDFQMDVWDGHFKGEIRLALLHHADGTVEEFSGGSINGSLPQAQGNLVFSCERYSDSSYDGPLAVKIENVAVAGE